MAAALRCRAAGLGGPPRVRGCCRQLGAVCGPAVRGLGAWVPSQGHGLVGRGGRPAGRWRFRAHAS
eukprot:10968960-Lingulodinium_polyedra.AAC.1